MDRERFGPGGAVMRTLVEAWADPREERVPAREGLGGGPPASPELAAWAEAFEEYALETSDPADAELRTPGDRPTLSAALTSALLGESGAADVWGALTGAAVVAEQGPLGWLASWAGTASGLSKVFSFHPDDWGLHPADPSISLFLLRLDEEARRDARLFAADGPRPMGLPEPEAASRFREAAAPESLPAAQDPERLAERASWILRGLIGLPLAAGVAAEMTLEVFEREIDLIPDHPPIALGWILAHALLGNVEAHRRVWSATRASPDAWLQEAREATGAWMEGQDARLGPLRRGDFELIQSAVRARALEAALEPTSEAISALVRARSELARSEEADDDPFLALFDALGGASELQSPEEEAKMADLARPRHRPLLDAALAEASKVSDHHPRAGRGRILARAALAPDLEALDLALAQAGGTERFGPTRRDELWRAVARFRDSAAHARLAHGASRFADEAEEWIRTASKVPWDALLARDCLESHELICRFLLRVAHTPVTAPLVLEAAAAARRLPVPRAVPGLRRAVSGGVGRIDDGGRAGVAWAVAELDPEAEAFLAAMVRMLRGDWEDADDEEDRERHALDLAVVVGPHLAVAPDSLESRATAATLLAELAPALAPGRRVSAAKIEALSAIARGAQQGEVGALLPPLRALVRVRPRRDRSNAEALERLSSILRAI